MNGCSSCKNKDCTSRCGKREGAIIDDAGIPIVDECDLEEIKEILEDLNNSGTCLVLSPFLDRVYAIELDWSIINTAMALQGLYEKYGSVVLENE